MKTKGTKIILILSLFILTNCQTNNVDYAAKVAGQYEIPKQELIDYYGNLYFAQRFPDSEYKGFGEALEELITKKLKQVDFINRGLHRDQELISEIQRVINEELLVLYFDTKYLGQYINEEVIEDYYEGLGRNVRYQQIVLKKDNAQDIELLKQKAFEIKEKAESGNDFSSLIQQYSEDLRSVQTDGNMLQMGWEEGTSSPYKQVIFRMPEGTVRILETPNNISIVKVNDVTEIEIRPLEEIRTEIKKNLRELYSPRAFADYDRDKANLIDKSKYDWSEDGLNQLVEWSRIDGFYREARYKKIIEQHLSDGKNFEILEYENGSVDLEKYLYLLNNILLIETSANATKDDFKKFIDEALRTELIVENAKQMGLDKNILSLETPSPVILEEFVQLYNKKFILSKIPETTDENYQQFYELTRDSLFYQPNKVNLRVKIFDSEKEAQDMMAQIDNGKEFEELFRTWAVKSYIINKQGNIESYLSPEPNYFGDEGFKLSQGETTGPIEFTKEGKTQFAIIKASNVEEEKVLALDEVHERRLERMFRNYYFNKISNEVNKELRNKYAVDINKQALIELSASKE